MTDKSVNKINEEVELVAPKGRILVKELEQQEKSVGGILLPSLGSDPENKARLGVVVSNNIQVNDLHTNRDYHKGTKLYFGKHAGATVQTETDKYISLLENEIVAIVK